MPRMHSPPSLRATMHGLSTSKVRPVIRELARALAQADPALSVFLFGSAANDTIGAVGDVDILLIGGGNCDTVDYGESLMTLRRRLLEGYRGVGFPTQPGGLEAVVRRFLQRQASSFGEILEPVFIFGPHDAKSDQVGSGPIALHFKGPLSGAQLSKFARVMPFHAYSILSSCRMLEGNFDVRPVLATIDLTYAELRRWVRSLERRVARYDEPAETRRCLRKLFQLTDAYSACSGARVDANNISDESATVAQVAMLEHADVASMFARGVAGLRDLSQVRQE